MGLHQTYTMDCDLCGNTLTDKYGDRTGSGESVTEHANDNGWLFMEIGGWRCPACLFKKEAA